jgi:hypothetical protein
MSDHRGQPVAPEPEWDKPPPRPFNREKFLLLLVAWILGVQFGLLILAGFMCSYGYLAKLQKITSSTDMPQVCPGILDKIKESAAESLAVLLALLGGGTIAVGEYQRRHPPQRPQAPLPEPEAWDVPPLRPMPPPPVMPATDPRAGAPLDPRDPRNRPPEDKPPLVGLRQGR